MKAGEALAAIAGSCVAQIAAHAPQVRRAGGIEDVHRMRVAVRKLRAALSIFRRAMGGRRLGFEVDLRWLQDKLGAVRDQDVFRNQAVAPLRDEARDVALVDEAAADERGAAYRDLCAALDSARCTSLWLAIARWLRSPEAMTGGTLDRPVERCARRELRRRAKKLRKRGRRIDSLDEADLHTLRIGVKKLRYAAEFFRDLFPEKRMKRAIKATTGLQDLLGALNDTRARAGRGVRPVSRSRRCVQARAGPGRRSRPGAQCRGP
jgi:triphosphatase